MKLMRASMLYVVLFAFGTVFFINSYYNYPAKNALNKASGNYTVGSQPDPQRPSNYIKELNKFSTLISSDQENLATCGSTVIETNYDQWDAYNPSVIRKYNTSSDKDCLGAECKEAAKDADMGGWLRLQLCEERDNKNIGCIPDFYTSGEVDVVAVKEFPMLEFLASKKAAEIASGGSGTAESTNSSDTTASVKGASSNGMNLTKFTQPFCIYNIFRNPEAQTKINTALSFSTEYKGPVYFNGKSCSAVVPYESLGNAASCWGIDWGDYINDAKFDVKSFYKEYWDTSITSPVAPQPDTWWSKFLDFFKSALSGDKQLAENDWLMKVSDVGEIHAKEVCKDLPGGPVTMFNDIAMIKSDLSYEVTRKLNQFNQNDTCSMQFLSSPKTALVRGIKSCEFDDAASTIFYENKLNDVIVKQVTKRNYSICLEYSKKEPTKCIRWYEWIECDPPKTICGTEYKCEKDSGKVYRYRDAFIACLATNKVVDIVPKDERLGINFRIEKDPFPELIMPNGSKLLRYTYDFEQLTAHNPVKYGDNIGIKMKVQRSLYDMNWCDGPCTYGQTLLKKPEKLSFDPVMGLQTGLINYIKLDSETPYNVLYKPGSSPLFPANTYDIVSDKNVASQSELYYYYPYVGNLSIMLERISVLLTNQGNNDTGSKLVGWILGNNPFPTLNNPDIKKILLDPCLSTPQYDIFGRKKDCFLDDDDGLLAQEIKDPNIVLPCGDGIDVSHWNGDIDWSAVAGDKIGYAIIKATEGTGFTDDKFAQNWNASKGKVKRTAYHFFRPEIDGAAQGDHFMKTVRAAGGGEDFNLAIDVEQPCNMEGSSCVAYSFDKKTSEDNLKKLLDYVARESGKNPMIYTSKYMWESVMTTGHPSWPVAQYPLWIAIYASGPGTMPNGWSDYAIWQYSSSGTVSGISSRVDMNKTGPAGTMLPPSVCPASNGTASNSSNNVSATNSNNPSVLGIGANRLTDIDSFKTYLKSGVFTTKVKNLCVGQSVSGSAGGPNVTVTYFPPGPTDVEPTARPTNVICTPKPLPSVPIGSCMLDNVKGKIATPLDGGYNTGYYEGHHGLDYSNGSLGTPVYAVSSGQVVYIRNLPLNDSIYYGGSPETADNQCHFKDQGRHQGTCDWAPYPDVSTPNATIWNTYGNVIVIKHNDGVTLYGHLKSGSINVKVGDCVLRNQQIAQMGNVGWSSGPHLHFEIRNPECPSYDDSCIINTNNTSMFDKSLSTPRTPSSNPIPPESCNE